MPRRKLQVVGRQLKPGCQVRPVAEEYRDTLHACIQFVDAGQYGACAEFLRHTPFAMGSHRALEIVMANSPPGSAGEAVRMALGETFR